MPGSTPATSQLDWLSSTTAMIVLSWSKATRDLLKSFSCGIGALRQLFASGMVPSPSPPAPYHLTAGGRWIRTLGPPATVELGSAGGARRDRCHPGTPIVRVDEFGERFPHARRAFHMEKSRRRARDRLPRLRISAAPFRLLGNVGNLSGRSDFSPGAKPKSGTKQ